MSRSIALIRSWENVSIVKENNSDSSLITLMNSKCDGLILDLYLDVSLESNTRWITCEISSLTLSIPFVIWRNNCYLLSKINKSNRKLVNHDTKSSNC